MGRLDENNDLLRQMLDELKAHRVSNPEEYEFRPPPDIAAVEVLETVKEAVAEFKEDRLEWMNASGKRREDSPDVADEIARAMEKFEVSETKASSESALPVVQGETRADEGIEDTLAFYDAMAGYMGQLVAPIVNIDANIQWLVDKQKDRKSADVEYSRKPEGGLLGRGSGESSGYADGNDDDYEEDEGGGNEGIIGGLFSAGIHAVSSFFGRDKGGKDAKNAKDSKGKKSPKGRKPAKAPRVRGKLKTALGVAALTAATGALAYGGFKLGKETLGRIDTGDGSEGGEAGEGGVVDAEPAWDSSQGALNSGEASADAAQESSLEALDNSFIGVDAVAEVGADVGTTMVMDTAMGRPIGRVISKGASSVGAKFAGRAMIGTAMRGVGWLGGPVGFLAATVATEVIMYFFGDQIEAAIGWAVGKAKKALPKKVKKAVFAKACIATANKLAIESRRFRNLSEKIAASDYSLIYDGDPAKLGLYPKQAAHLKKGYVFNEDDSWIYWYMADEFLRCVKQLSKVIGVSKSFGTIKVDISRNDKIIPDWAVEDPDGMEKYVDECELLPDMRNVAERFKAEFGYEYGNKPVVEDGLLGPGEPEAEAVSSGLPSDSVSSASAEGGAVDSESYSSGSRTEVGASAGGDTGGYDAGVYEGQGIVQGYDSQGNAYDVAGNIIDPGAVAHASGASGDEESFGAFATADEAVGAYREATRGMSEAEARVFQKEMARAMEQDGLEDLRDYALDDLKLVMKDVAEAVRGQTIVNHSSSSYSMTGA